MTFIRNIRLGLLHIAVAITFVLINGVLNRVMIYNLGILASVVALLAILPYVLSPLQMWIGQYSDTHPIMGLRRTPYIALGIVLCLGGTVLTPYAAFLMAPAGQVGLSPVGVLLGFVAFLSWGFGYNLAVVSYLSLASDLSTEQNRPRAIAIMWFMMITSLIITAITVGRAMEPYSEAQLIRVFWIASGAAFGIALIGLIGLEPRRASKDMQPAQTRTNQIAAIQTVLRNPQAQRFFIYLTLLLAAILGQDVLLEPYGAHQFGLTVRQTTQLTATWGGATLLALLLYGLLLNRWMSKKTGAAIGGGIAALGLLTIAVSGLLQMQALFVPGIAALGFGTGISTSTNLALMLDMTTAEQAGLFIGAWGVADALARGAGMLLGGVMRDVVTGLTGNPSIGYISVFMVEAGLLACSLLLLRSINVAAFRNQPQPTLTQLVSLVGDA